MIPSNSTDEPRQTLSGLKVCQCLAEKLKQFDNYPLLPDNLVVQTDALKRLGDFGDENWEIFAALDHNRAENDSSLRFSLTLSGAGFSLTIEGIGSYVRSYGDVAVSEDGVATQLLAAVQMLSSGQVFVLSSILKGKLRAVEVVCRTSEGKPRTLSVQHADFPLTLSKDIPSAYDWHVSKNDYDFPHIPLPKNFFLALKTPEGKELKLDRPFPGGALSPYTKYVNDRVTAGLDRKLAGARDDTELGKKILGSWELWGIGLASTASSWILLPGDMRIWAVPLLTALGLVIASIAVLKLIKYKYQLRHMHKDHLYVRVDALVRSVLSDVFSTYGLHVATMLALVLTLFLPIYVTKEEHLLASFIQLIVSGVPIAALPALGLLAAFGSALRKNVDSFGHSFWLGFTSVIGILVVNFSATYTGDAVVSPEPQTSITVILYAVYLLVMIALIARGIRKLKKERGQAK